MENRPMLRTSPEGGKKIHQVFYAARQALNRHASGGNILIAVTLLAMIVANLPMMSDYYTAFWDHEIRLQVGRFNLFSHAGHPMTLLQFINDALMAVFFFSIGLEIKREVLVGELSSFRQALLPIMAAVGGMILPVGIFMLMSHGTEYAGGAAIPMATDIAFTLGVLALFGARVPLSVKIFLTTLAVVDDIGGIIVIAAFYSGHIEVTYLIYAAIALAVLVAGGMFRIQSKMFYVIFGVIVWFLFLNSGIHPTIAGVLVAFTIPASPVYAPANYIKIIRKNAAKFSADDEVSLNSRTILDHDQMDWLKQIESASDKVISPLQDMEDSLHPVINYLIIPLFAFANAGIYLLDVNPAEIIGGLSLAIVVALTVGKFTGILLFSWLTVKMGLAPMPDNSNWKMIAGIAMLGGIGFTVSLFIANLTFADVAPLLLKNAKIGIVIASLLAGLAGFAILHFALPKGSQRSEL